MEITPTPRELKEKWTQRAQFLREYGDTSCARLWELAANELTDALETHGDETLSLTEAGRESGYSPDHLSRLIKRGVIANAGREGAPRIRRADVPVKDPNGAGRPSKKGRSSTSPAGKVQVSERATAVARAFSRKR